MKNKLLQFSAVSLFTVAIAGAPLLSRAAETNPPPKTGQIAPEKPRKQEGLVFKGKVNAVDAQAMTLKVGERTFVVTPEAKITKNGQPATLEEIAVGDAVGGAYKKAAEGKLEATTINDGKKPKVEKP